MDRTGPKILCVKTPIVMGNFNANALAQKTSKKGKNQTLKHYLREGHCNAPNFNLLNTRVLSPTSAINFSIPPWQHAPIIVYDNTTKDSLNIKAATAFAQQTTQSLQWYYSTDFYQKKIIEDENLIQVLLTLHSSKTNQRLTCIPFVVGMPVLVSHNFSVDDGVVNGARGTVKTI